MTRIDRSVPGPSPWYLERPSAALKNAADTWTWQFAHGHPHSRKSDPYRITRLSL